MDKQPPEVTEAKALAARYRLPFIDLLPPEEDSPIDYDELAKLPVDLMLRNQFVPLRREGNNLHAAMADPSNLERLDELENVLNVRIVPYVATAGAIDMKYYDHLHESSVSFSAGQYGILRGLFMVAPEDEMVHANYSVTRQAYELIPTEKRWYDICDGHFGLLYHPGERFNEAVGVQAEYLRAALDA